MGDVMLHLLPRKCLGALAAGVGLLFGVCRGLATATVRRMDSDGRTRAIMTLQMLEASKGPWAPVTLIGLAAHGMAWLEVGGWRRRRGEEKMEKCGEALFVRCPLPSPLLLNPAGSGLARR